MTPCRIEFYERRKGLITALRAPAVPRQGEYVNIERRQWKVAYVSWAVDLLPNGLQDLRANVELEKIADSEVGPIGEGS